MMQREWSATEPMGTGSDLNELPRDLRIAQTRLIAIAVSMELVGVLLVLFSLRFFVVPDH